jgi:hypothetical protein
MITHLPLFVNASWTLLEGHQQLPPIHQTIKSSHDVLTHHNHLICDWLFLCLFLYFSLELLFGMWWKFVRWFLLHDSQIYLGWKHIITIQKCCCKYFFSKLCNFQLSPSKQHITGLAKRCSWMCSQSEAQPWICMTSDRNMFVRIENLWNDLIICREISNQALRCYYHWRTKTRKNS